MSGWCSPATCLSSSRASAVSRKNDGCHQIRGSWAGIFYDKIIGQGAVSQQLAVLRGKGGVVFAGASVFIAFAVSTAILPKITHSSPQFSVAAMISSP